MSEGTIDVLLYIAYGLLGLGVVSIVLFVIKHMIANPRRMLRSLIGLGLLAVVFGVAYATASGEPVAGIEVSETVLRFIEALLRVTYVAFLGGIGLLIVSEIVNLVR